ncbi:MAG: ABC1 kinase family protein [Nitrospirota bacterium]
MIVFESGGAVVVERLRLHYLLPLRHRLGRLVRRRAPAAELARGETKALFSPPALRALLERLGPTFVKLGQILSMRADLVGTEISEELSKLQSNVGPFPYETARQILKTELGGYPEDVFASFEPVPVAAASLAQVHRAFLNDGAEVAVKVQRPGIRKIVEQDIHILSFLAGLAERFIPEFRIYQPLRIVREFSDWTLRELDFRAEGHNAERFRYIFRENQDISIPKVYWDYTTPRVLTAAFSHGAKVTDLDRIAAFGVDRKKLASIGVDAFFQQFFVAGFFHADPHPGNFFAMPDGSLCLHDFGMVGYLDQASRRELLSCLIAFVNKDIEAYTKHLLHLAVTDQHSDVMGFEKDTAGILSEFFFSERAPSVAWAFFRVINNATSRGVRFSADLALFGKALVTTEGMGSTLYPEFDLNSELAPFVTSALKGYFAPRRLFEQVQTDLLDYAASVRSLPDRVLKVLGKLEKGEIGVKLDTGDLDGMKKEFDRQNDLRILGMVLTAVIFATLALLHSEGTTTLFGVHLSRLGVAVSAILFVWLVLRLRHGPRT